MAESSIDGVADDMSDIEIPHPGRPFDPPLYEGPLAHAGRAVAPGLFRAVAEDGSEVWVRILPDERALRVTR